MKNLNALVEEGIQEYVEKFPELIAAQGHFYLKNGKDMGVRDFFFDFARKVAETALKECRTDEYTTQEIKGINEISGNGVANRYIGFNQCLSEFDELVKEYLK
jgi:hypothetical protein